MKTLRLILAAMLVSIASFALTPITGPTTVCVGGCITLADATPGGIWSSSAPAIASADSITGVVCGYSAGVVTISYMGGGAVVTYTITVNPSPAAITGPSSVGAGGSITLADATPGGTWSSSNPSVATINPSTGVLTGVSSGTTTITYCLPSGCCVSRTITVGSALHLAPQIASGEASITIYPNPAKANPTIQWENQAIGYVTITISNIVGREVYKTSVAINATAGNAPLDLSSLKDGVYIMNIKSVDVNYTTRLILQK